MEHRHRLALRSDVVAVIALLSLLVAACGSSTAAVSQTPTIPPPPTPTSLPPTPSGTPVAPAGTFYFTTDDGVTLNGRTFGKGKTAIVLSNQNAEQKEEWAGLVDMLVAKGYLVVTYDYRGIGASHGNYNVGMLEHDLKAAIKVAQARGATRILLMGASLGGLVTAKVAATMHPYAVAILSAPQSFRTLAVNDDEMRKITAPKYFAVSTGDSDAYPSMQYLYDASAQPKQLKTFAGVNHGVELFLAAQTKTTFLDSLAAFLKANAPA